ncbi:MAG: glycosyltransferase [Bacteroidetes bacterium]|nr:glycosyltransferase [Bacteroidota bacterium]
MKISIITPNYNYASFIGKTIESILFQGYTNIEHVIVDDGSTDNSVDVIQQYVTKYPGKIKLITQSNSGQSKALNVALENTSGDIICWLNSDDIFLPGAFEKVIAGFRSKPEQDAVFGNIIIIDSEGKKIKNVKYLPFDYGSGVFNGFGKIVPSNAIFWKRNLTFNDPKVLFNNALHYAMDSDYWSRLLLNKKVRHVNFYFAGFRYHEKAKTIIRLEKDSKAYLDSTKEDQFVYSNALKNTGIESNVSKKILRVYFKIKRHGLKLMFGHYFN